MMDPAPTEAQGGEGVEAPQGQGLGEGSVLLRSTLPAPSAPLARLLGPLDALPSFLDSGSLTDAVLVASDGAVRAHRSACR